MARRYEFYVLVARTISHSFAALTREILLLPLEHKIHIFSPPCNILYISNSFDSSMFLHSQAEPHTHIKAGTHEGACFVCTGWGYLPGSVFRERVSVASSLACTGLNEDKETSEFNFSWLSWLAVLFVGAYARRQWRRRGIRARYGRHAYSG